MHPARLLLPLILAACSSSDNVSAVDEPARDAGTPVAARAADAHNRASAQEDRTPAQHGPAAPAESTVVERIARAGDATQAPRQTPVFWTADAYTVEGVRHFTGFAYFPGAEPAETAVLGQVTYLLATPQIGATWKEVLAEPNVGSVGARGRAYAVDPRRAVVTSTPSPRDRIIAVPVDGAIEQGIVPKLYEILVRTADARWHHAGSIEAGADDSAGCDDGRAYPCAPIEGSLAFATTQGGLPDIIVTLAGGSAHDASREQYRYDPNTRRYTRVK